MPEENKKKNIVLPIVAIAIAVLMLGALGTFLYFYIDNGIKAEATAADEAMRTEAYKLYDAGLYDECKKKIADVDSSWATDLKEIIQKQEEEAAALTPKRDNDLSDVDNAYLDAVLAGVNKYNDMIDNGFSVRRAALTEYKYLEGITDAPAAEDSQLKKDVIVYRNAIKKLSNIYTCVPRMSTTIEFREAVYNRFKFLYTLVDKYDLFYGDELAKKSVEAGKQIANDAYVAYSVVNSAISKAIDATSSWDYQNTRYQKYGVLFKNTSGYNITSLTFRSYTADDNGTVYYEATDYHTHISNGNSVMLYAYSDSSIQNGNIYFGWEFTLDGY